MRDLKYLANGANRSYRMAVTEATNKASQRVFQKQKFAERVRRVYGAYKFDGRHLFESIVDEGGPALMDKNPGSIATS